MFEWKVVYSELEVGGGFGTAVFWYDERLRIWISSSNEMVSIDLENGIIKIGEVGGEGWALRESFPYFVVEDSLYVAPGFLADFAGIDLKCFGLDLRKLEMREVGCDFSCAYTAFVQAEDRMFVFGGYCGEGLSNELSQVKVGNGLEIEVLTQSFKYPKPRYEHSLQEYGKYLWVFGGCSGDEL